MTTRFGFLGISLASVVLLGCGESGPVLVPASGSVTLDGKPLKNVVVTFFPQPSGPASSGMADVDGEFKLYGPGSKEGAVVGKCLVTVVPGGIGGTGGPDGPPSTGSSADPSKGKEMTGPPKEDPAKEIPGVYQDSTTTTLTAVVPAGGSTSLELKLVSE